MHKVNKIVRSFAGLVTKHKMPNSLFSGSISIRMQWIPTYIKRLIVPYKRYRVAFLKDSTPTRIMYHYTLGGSIIIDNIESLTKLDNWYHYLRNRDCDIVINWNKYLTRQIRLTELNRYELADAMPYQIALNSPFEAHEIIYCLRSRYNVSADMIIFDVDYANKVWFDDFPGLLSFYRIYPQNAYSANHLVHELACSLAKCDEADHTNPIFYFTFDESKVTMGLVGSLGLPPKSIKIDFKDKNWTEYLYNKSINYLAEFQIASNNQNVSRVLLLGNTNIATTYRDSIAKSFPSKVEIIDPGLILKQELGFCLKESIEKSAPLWFYSYLYSQKHEASRIQPQKQISSSTTYPVYSKLLKIVIPVLLLLVLIPLYLFSAQHKYEQIKNEMSDHIAELTPIVSRLSDMKQEIDMRLSGSDYSDNLIDHLYLIAKAKPTDIKYTSLDYLYDNRLSIAGICSNMASPVEYTKALEKDFENVNLSYISQKGSASGGIIEFQIEIIL